MTSSPQPTRIARGNTDNNFTAPSVQKSKKIVTLNGVVGVTTEDNKMSTNSKMFQIYCVDTSKKWINNSDVEVIISTGGTGLTGRDVSPEAFRSMFDKEIEGFGELFRFLSFKKIGTSTIQSRALAGVANGTYIFVLPGSPSACKDAWEEILIHQLDYRHKPCNFVEIIPRLLEKGTGRSGKS